MYILNELLQLWGSTSAHRSWIPVLEPGVLWPDVGTRVAPVPVAFQHIFCPLLACPAFIHALARRQQPLLVPAECNS